MWMAIRYLIGDTLFDALFSFEKDEFILTQKWHVPMNKAESEGNLSYHFYDDPARSTIETWIGAKTVYNHPEYIAKHPGGTGRLQNVIRIHEGDVDSFVIFEAEASRPEITTRL